MVDSPSGFGNRQNYLEPAAPLSAKGQSRQAVAARGSQADPSRPKTEAAAIQSPARFRDTEASSARSPCPAEELRERFAPARRGPRPSGSARLSAPPHGRPPWP